MSVETLKYICSGGLSQKLVLLVGPLLRCRGVPNGSRGGSSKHGGRSFDMVSAGAAGPLDGGAEEDRREAALL